MVQTPDRSTIEKELSDRLASLRNELSAVIPSATSSEDSKRAFVEQSKIDDALAEYVVLNEATPRGLADFIVSGDGDDDYCPAERQALVNGLLGDPGLMARMIEADGAKNGRYGRAVRIYREIQGEKEDRNDAHPVLDKLALAVALEHAAPVPQNNPIQPKDGEQAEKFVHPVRRYLSYESAYLKGELDASFEMLTDWELRMVVDGDEPDETSAWGRSMLRNFRPDHILSPDEAWRYVMLVRTEVRYGSGDVKYDRPELQMYQNILMNGGVCGRRAFEGRFILRAFGIPTTARPSTGHGALCHWTLHNGWVVNLGAGWGAGWTLTRYRRDKDFLATTQARRFDPHAYLAVKRAQWTGDVLGEQPVWGPLEDNAKQAGPWYGLSLKLQQEIIGRNNPPAVRAAKNQVSTLAQKVIATPSSRTAERISCNREDGTIVIPAASFENPRRTKDVNVMPSFSNGRGGLQIYLPPFLAQGLSVLRGGTWKQDANTIYSGWRLKSGGYGKYHDWGFRVVLGLGDDDGSHSHPKDFRLNIPDTDQYIDFIYIKPGTFIMGGESNVDGRFQCVELPKHQVKITKAYYIGKFPVTQAQYEAVCQSNPSQSTRAPDCPVDTIGEGDALAFCNKVTEVAGREVRLPTEAEWEYACRAGCGDTKWFFGDDPGPLGEYAWFQDNSGGASHPVGTKKANPWDIHDMYGNVVERCSDKYDKDYYKSEKARVDPTGPSVGIKSSFEYKVSVPTAGKYALSGEVVTVNYKQRLMVSTNGRDETSIAMPFTLGEWQQFAPVVVYLQKGDNTLRFWRNKPPQYALVIKEFTLRPTTK